MNTLRFCIWIFILTMNFWITANLFADLPNPINVDYRFLPDSSFLVSNKAIYWDLGRFGEKRFLEHFRSEEKADTNINILLLSPRQKEGGLWEKDFFRSFTNRAQDYRLVCICTSNKIGQYTLEYSLRYILQKGKMVIFETNFSWSLGGSDYSFPVFRIVDNRLIEISYERFGGDYGTCEMILADMLGNSRTHFNGISTPVYYKVGELFLIASPPYPELEARKYMEHETYLVVFQGGQKLFLPMDFRQKFFQVRFFNRKVFLLLSSSAVILDTKTGEFNRISLDSNLEFKGDCIGYAPLYGTNAQGKTALSERTEVYRFKRNESSEGLTYHESWVECRNPKPLKGYYKNNNNHPVVFVDPMTQKWLRFGTFWRWAWIENESGKPIYQPMVGDRYLSYPVSFPVVISVPEVAEVRMDRLTIEMKAGLIQPNYLVDKRVSVFQLASLKGVDVNLRFIPTEFNDWNRPAKESVEFLNQYPVIRSLSAPQSLFILEKKGRWFHVYVHAIEEYGWIYEDYVQAK